MPQYPDFLTITGYGKVDGLAGVNCRHSFSPFYPDISTPRWSPEELEKYKEKTYTYTNAQGEEKTVDAYEASQILRRLERRVRDIKRRLAVEESKGDDLARPEVLIKLRRQRAEANKQIEKFTSETGLKRQNFRERIAKKR